MARLCEEGGEAEGGEKEDAFGQEADLVSQVRQLLQEYGDGADLVTEFVQNNDDAGAGCVAFFLVDEKFGTERVVDPRTTALQGPALYVCSDKPLSPDDIARMQRVGRSEKRLDFKSSGRFGVGLNVMYRYCDCPQLLANGRLHYFDLTQKFVAKPGMRRGRQFTVEKLHEAFPDSHAPFEVKVIADRFPTIFRLALRAKRSDLGVAMDVPTVRSELTKASEIADKMLLFTRNLKRLEFHDSKKLINSHEATVKDPEAYAAFFKELPASIPDLKAGKYNQIIAQKNIVTENPKGKTDAEWAIAHRVGADQAMLDVLKAQFEQPHGVALLPHGAAAARVKPAEDELRGGRICCGLPTPFRSNSCAWINGSFALLSSRKTLPLPDDKESKPTLDKQWNKMLLEGPVALSMRGLILHCTAMVLFSGMDLERYFGLFPIRGDRLQSILSQATWKSTIKDAVFPVAKGAKKMTWVQGPTPPFFSKDLSDDVQECLVKDGLRLVALPPELLLEYEEALGKPRESVSSQDLCKFLRETYEKLHPEVKNAEPEPEDGKDAEASKGFELDPTETGMECLSSKAYIMELLKFAVKGIWAAYAKAKAGKFTKFSPDELAGVPLLMTHAQEVTTFKNGVKYSTWRDILPEKKSLFLDRETYVTVMDSVDTTVVGVQREVETEIPGVRPFTLKDLLPYRPEVERSVEDSVPWAHPGNEPLRVFWSLVAETFAEDLQATNYQQMYNAANRTFHDAKKEGATKDGKKDNGDKKDGEKKEGEQMGAAKLKPDTGWSRVIWDWKVLPICSKDGTGENGETVVALSDAIRCVAVTHITSEEDVVRSLSELLTDCGIEIIQHDTLSDNRISRLLRTLVVSTNEEMLKVLHERGNLSSLTGVQRHDLLAYFSVLSVKGGVDLHGVTKLPLFKTASMESSFIALEGNTQYCCVDPSDPHSKALSKLMPPGMIMLAWPTQQVKPIYEHCNIQLCNGEDFMVTQIIPRLPDIVDSGPNGKFAEPFLVELHSFVCTDDSDKVKRAAMECEFVTAEDFSKKGCPCQFTSPTGGAAAAFKEVLSAHLPAKWMQKSDKHMELLHALGMERNLTPAMILMCAKDLDSGAGDKADPSNDNALAVIEEEEEKDKDEKEGRDVKRRKMDAQRALRSKSWELVEEWARAADEVWPKRSLGTSSQTAPEYKHGEKIALPPTRDPIKVEDMACLVEAASLRILMTRRHKTQKSRKDDALDRNSKKKLKTKPLDRGQGPSAADLELCSLYGTAFSKSRQVLWTICPLSAHGSPNRNKEGDSKYLKTLLENHKKGMYEVFGTYAMPGQAPLELVMRHLACLCTIMQSEPGAATVNTDSLLHDDFRLCWQYLSENLTIPLPEELSTPMCKQVLQQLKDLPCVAVSSEDAANVSVDVTTLTRPRFAFFQLPLLKGKQANLRLYLRQVNASTASEASIFRMLGATDTPRASHFAGASERVASKAQELGRANWEWVVAVLEACVKGVYEDITDKAAHALEGVKKEIKNLHMFTTAGTIMPARKLTWADEPRWLKRCERTKILSFCALNGHDQRDIAQALVEHLGVRQLTKLVEERRMVEGANANSEGAPKPRAFKERLESLLRSPEFCCGLHAVMEQQANENKKTLGVTVTGVGQELRTIRWRAASGKLRSALFWKEKEAKKKKGKKRKVGEENGEEGEKKEGESKDGEKKDGKGEKKDSEMKDSEKKEGKEEEAEEEEEEEEEDVAEDLPTGEANTIIDGSEQVQQVYFDEFERTVYVGDAEFGDDSFTAELVFALRRALPLLWGVDNFLLEAMLRCALTEGPDSIAGFLEKRDIKVDTNMPRQLGPGDQLPEDLQDSLVWAMDTTYAEGECCAVLINDVFTIAEVCKFPSDQKQGEGLTRSYFLKLTVDKFEVKKHFEVYKIRTNRMTAEGISAEPETTDLALYSEKEAKESAEKKATEPEKAQASEEGKAKEMTEEDEETTIKDLKRYLHEMGQMEPEDYKAVMRRLFKTWHPDKAGDTPLSKRIFHMLRAHEQWYKKRQSGEETGDDSWLDKEDGKAPAGPKPSGGEDDGKILAIEGPEGGFEDGAGGQSSWFEEFEKEMAKAREAKEAGEEAKPYTRMPGAGEKAPENKRDKADWEREQQEREEKAAQVRIVDKVLATRYLQEAKLELVAVKRLMQEVDGVRSMPSRAVWHCQQAVEMGLKSAMLRTCGVAEDEVVGGAAHDLIDFIARLKTAEVNTEEQRRAQNVPLEGDDVEWLKRAYLAARYPKPGRYGVPTLLYSDKDADRALRLAEGFLQWAERVEDLPDPNKFRRRWSSVSASSTIKDTTPKDAKEAEAAAAPSASGPRGTLGQKGKAAPAKPPATVAAASKEGSSGGLGLRRISSTDSASGGLGLKRMSSTDSTGGQPASKAAKPGNAGGIAMPTPKAPAGIKRPGDSVVVDGESEPPRRWSKRNLSQ
uniref:HEPN domain-containing protein n=1 Tax=Alexandrium monilatum TaxID=311494 RepID=A0A7S4SRI7_9DINO